MAYALNTVSLDSVVGGDYFTVGALSLTPTSVVCIVVKPSGGTDDNLFATIRGVPTAGGFTVDFSSPIPTTGYKLSYIALS